MVQKNKNKLGNNLLTKKEIDDGFCKVMCKAIDERTEATNLFCGGFMCFSKSFYVDRNLNIRCAKCNKINCIPQALQVSE